MKKNKFITSTIILIIGSIITKIINMIIRIGISRTIGTTGMGVYMLVVPAFSLFISLSQMGLPVANIICACNDNGAVWDLIHTGHLRTDVPTARTTTPLADFAVPAELERLIFGKLGIDEAMRFGHLALEGGQYTLASFAMDILRNGMFAAVVSSDRVAALVPSAYSTCRYVMGPYTVLAYGALMDYRSRTGERRPALILADRSPVCDSTFVAKALNISAFELKQRIETP